MSLKEDFAEALCTPILNTRGPLHEGDLFAALRRISWIVRSAEFGLADGAINCTRTYSASDSYMERLWKLHQDQRSSLSDRDRLLLFDVKSTNSRKPGRQILFATKGQSRQVAFFIVICLADRTYVEIHPNMQQTKERSTLEEPNTDAENMASASEDAIPFFLTMIDSGNEHEIEDATSRSNLVHNSWFPPHCYGNLDPRNAIYRMPLHLLPQALDSVRTAAQTGGFYQNPWSRVVFKRWRPRTTDLVDALRPTEDAPQFSAFLAVLDIYRAMITSRRLGKTFLELDFVGLQPRLADFKLLYRRAATEVKNGCQVLVQHKLDSRYRAHAAPLHRVSIARSREDGTISWYFNPLERFDYLFYQFTISGQGEQRSQIEVFFLPERILPDEFYTTTDTEVNFERAEFQPYRFVQDVAGQWVEKIQQIILAHVSPRLDCVRPWRAESLSAFSGQHFTPWEQEQTYQSRPRFTAALGECHRRFFYVVNNICASRRSGLIIITGTRYSICDFLFCSFVWSEEQSILWQQHKVPPATLSSIRSETPLVAIYVYTSSSENTFQSPEITASQFMRINTIQQPRLFIWDSSGLDAPGGHLSWAVVPTTDIKPTRSQRRGFENATAAKQRSDRAPRTALLSDMLCSGLLVHDYCIDLLGPMALDWACSQHIVTLLHNFMGLRSFQHPPGITRNPQDFQMSLGELYQTQYNLGFV